MNGSLILIATAALVAVTHTLIPDHWLPYVAMSRGKGWSTGKTMRVTAIGAAIHLVTTAIIGLLLGFVGIAAINVISDKADFIGGILLLAFGLYFTWKGWKAYKFGGGHSHAGHSHPHPHGHEEEHAHNCEGHSHSHEEEHVHNSEGHSHSHEEEHAHNSEGHSHSHEEEHAHNSEGHSHSHGEKVEKSDFALGAILGARPCAEAIPIFLAASSIGLTSSIFAVAAWVIATLVSMLGIVWLSLKGLEASKLKVLDKFGELGAGLVIVLVGVIMMLIGV